MKKYLDRYEAGRILAELLMEYTNDSNALILALPRGGVPVAYEIAKSLSLPLDVFIVRKLGVPGHEELAMGAIATGEMLVFNDDIIKTLNITKSSIDKVIQFERNELQRRELNYRGNRPLPNLFNKTVILVDDGIATGASIRVAIKAIRQQNPNRIILAVPVASYTSYKEMENLADEIICPIKPDEFYAVGAWYENFSQTSDEEVFDLLVKAHVESKS